MKGRIASVTLMPCFSLLTKNQVIDPKDARRLMQKYIAMKNLDVNIVAIDLCSLPIAEDKQEILSAVLDEISNSIQ